MTYDQILTLDAIIKCGSFKAASQFLNKTQPSLSVAIKKLEEEFQVTLFDRSEYRPSLTYEGKLFYERVKPALSSMRQLELFGQELGMNQEKEVRVGLDGLAPLKEVLPLLNTFFGEFSSTSLTLIMDNISGTYNKLINDELEIGITPLHYQNEQIDSFKIADTYMIPVCSSKNFPVANESFESLKRLPQIIVTDSDPKAEDKSFGVLEDSKKWTVTDITSKKEIILNGLGWGRLPHFLIEEELKTKQLREIEVSNIETHKVPIYIARNKSKAMGPITKKLWKLLQTDFKK